MGLLSESLLGQLKRLGTRLARSSHLNAILESPASLCQNALAYCFDQSDPSSAAQSRIATETASTAAERMIDQRRVAAISASGAFDSWSLSSRRPMKPPWKAVSTTTITTRVSLTIRVLE